MDRLGLGLLIFIIPLGIAWGLLNYHPEQKHSFVTASSGRCLELVECMGEGEEWTCVDVGSHTHTLSHTTVFYSDGCPEPKEPVERRQGMSDGEVVFWYWVLFVD